MDKGLQIQVELSRKGKTIFSKIKRDIKTLSKEARLEYLLSTETVISISDKKIWIYGIIEDIGGREMCTVSVFDNPLGNRKLVREALCFYLVNSEYSYEFGEEVIFEKEIKSMIRIFPAII